MSKISVTAGKSDVWKRVSEICFFFLGFFLVAVTVVHCFSMGLLQMRTKAVLSIGVEISGMIVCLLLYFAAFVDQRKSAFRQYFLSLVFLELLVFFVDSIYWFTAKKPEYNTVLIISNCVQYIVVGMIFITFWGCEIEIMNLNNSMPKFVKNGMRVLMIAYMLSILLNIKFGFYYTIKDGVYTANPKTGFLIDFLPLIVCLVLIYYAITEKTLLKIKLTFILMAVLPVAAYVLQRFWYYSWFVYASLLISSFVLYINIQVNLGHQVDEFRNKVMISQIQPHFMYNTLTTIKALCRRDPDLAAKTITNFADYLRGNMDFASLETTIPLERELNHTRIYTEIEALRFDNITFEFNIEDENFEVPALCIQPMVENAVRHGVRSRKNGHILVHTYTDENFHVIVIKDNGKGFDHAQFNGSRTHIGLLNTKLRIERLVNGKFDVESVPDEGVTITMRIPK